MYIGFNLWGICGMQIHSYFSLWHILAGFELDTSLCIPRLCLVSTSTLKTAPVNIYRTIQHHISENSSLNKQDMGLLCHRVYFCADKVVHKSCSRNSGVSVCQTTGIHVPMIFYLHVCQAYHIELQGCDMLRILHCLDSRLTDGGKVVSLRHRPLLYSPESLFFCFWYSFLLEAE
jgi:hypothetical protein